MANPAGYTQEEIDEVLATLIGFAGNASAAHRHLQAEGKRTPTPPTIREWAQTAYWERYEELREKYAQKVEGRLVNDMLDVSRQLVEATQLAAERAVERLKANKDDDPGRTASNLSMAGSRMMDKRLSHLGRPTRITENRDATEILRSLVATGVLVAPEEPKQLEEGDA